MLSNAPLADPKDVAWFLASYARNYTPEELAAFEAGAAALGLPAAQIRALLGERTCDVYLNGVAYWKNIPQLVWEYTIGGYQVIKKWLSYRERALLGRSLTAEQVREVGAMARRIAALLLAPTLDGNYRAVKAATVDWSNSATSKSSFGSTTIHRLRRLHRLWISNLCNLRNLWMHS